MKQKSIGIAVTYRGYDSVKEDAITRAFGKYHWGCGTTLDSGERDHTGGVHPRAFPRVWAQLKRIPGVRVARIEEKVCVPLTAREISTIRKAIDDNKLRAKLADWAKELQK
jgi:hypothetical protein